MSIECAFFGSLSRDAARKLSKGEKSYLHFSVRVESGDKATFVNVRSFDTDALAIADKLTKGARVYVEGRLSMDEWTTEDGTLRRGLSCMSFHTRLSAIGRNKPKRSPGQRSPVVSGRERAERSDFAPSGAAPVDMNDEIPFAPEWR